MSPWPAGDFRVETINFFVGSGIGPFSFTPVLSAISRISPQIVLISWGSVLDNRILAFETIPGCLQCFSESGIRGPPGVALKRYALRGSANLLLNASPTYHAGFLILSFVVL